MRKPNKRDKGNLEFLTERMYNSYQILKQELRRKHYEDL